MIVGLTGGIASGKSAVAAMLAERGARVVDADQVAREVVRPGAPAFQEIVDRFGTHVLSPDGTLDRAQLGAVVFGDAAARADLERILHPRIYAALADRLERMDRERMRVVEAALLVETLDEARRWLQLDALVVVTCSEPAQLARLRAKGLTAAQAEDRIRSQMATEEKTAHADYVLRNDGSLDDLQAQVSVLWDRLVAGAHR